MVLGGSGVFGRGSQKTDLQEAHEMIQPHRAAQGGFSKADDPQGRGPN